MKNDSTPKEEANLECEICGRQQRSFNVVWDKGKSPHLLCGQCQRKKRVDSTPSKGWEGATRQCVEANVYSGDSNLQKIDYIMAHIGTVLKQEIAKARHQERQEIAEELKKIVDWKKIDDLIKYLEGK